MYKFDFYLQPIAFTVFWIGWFGLSFLGESSYNLSLLGTAMVAGFGSIVSVVFMNVALAVRSKIKF